MHETPSELPNDLRLKIKEKVPPIFSSRSSEKTHFHFQLGLGPLNWKISRKSLKRLDLIGSTQTNTQKQFLAFVPKNREKSTAKYFIGKYTSLNFLNLSTIFCIRKSEKTHFHFQLGLDPLKLRFLEILVFKKTHLLLKLKFRQLSCNKQSKKGQVKNLALKAVPVAAGQYF